MLSGKAATKHIEWEAVVFPPCQHCNQPYKPSKPIVNYGTVMFRSSDWLANVLFKVEQFIKNLRTARLRSK